MDRLSEILYEPTKILFEGETLIYFTKDSMIIRTFEGEDLVQIEGKPDARLPEFINSLLDQ